MDARRSSALPFCRGLVWVAWAGTLLAGLYLAVGVPSGALDARMVNPWLGVGPWDSGLVIGFSRESLAPQQWRSFCLSVGIWSLAGTLSVFTAIDQVRKILMEDPAKSPFTAGNARRVRIAGIAVICAGVAKALRDLAFAHFVAKNVRIPGTQVGYVSDLGLSTAFLGIMILAVAEVMSHGVKLQEDQDLTV